MGENRVFIEHFKTQRFCQLEKQPDAGSFEKKL